MKFFSNLFCSQPMRGPRFDQLAQLYVQAINNGTKQLSLGVLRVSVNHSPPVQLRLFSCPRVTTQLQIEASMDSNSAVADGHKSNAAQLQSVWTHIRTSQFWMVAIGLFLRVGWIIAGHTYRFKPAENNFGFGWEMGRIGAAIASGHGFSDPFGAATRPTAWEPPLYPYLTASVFHFFGIYSHASAFVLLTINSIFSALTCVPIFLIARRIFSEKVAVGSAWTWTLLPYVMFWCTRWVWETSFSALLVAVIFWLALTMEDRDGLKPWLQFGLLWGVAALNSTVLIAFLPASGLWA